MSRRGSGSRPAPRSLLAGLGLLAALALACGEAAPPQPSVEPGAALALLRGDDPPLFLDVRTPAEYERAHIPGALNVPHTEVALRIDEIRAEGRDEIIVLCERGGRARAAREELAAAGIGGVSRLSGEMRAWRSRRMPTVSGPERGALAD